MSRAPGKAEKLIDQFQSAVADYEQLGSIPVSSPDREEQARIDKERSRIAGNYTRAYNRLLKALETNP
jgi:hypothetical protein